MYMIGHLTLKAPIATAADGIHKYFSEKIRLNVSSESSIRQRIHIKYQALFSSKDKIKKIKCRLLQILFGALKSLDFVLYRLTPPPPAPNLIPSNRQVIRRSKGSANHLIIRLIKYCRAGPLPDSGVPMGHIH